MIVNEKNNYLKVTKLTTLNGCFFVFFCKKNNFAQKYKIKK